MKLKTNYHSHSKFCDGKSSMQEMIESAIKRGFTHFGVSSHAPFPFENDFAIQDGCFEAYKNEFFRLKNLYSKQIHLYLGLEMDYITDIIEDTDTPAKNYGLEYYIGSVHQVKEHNDSNDMWFIDGSKVETYDNGLRDLFDMDIKRAVHCYYQSQINMIRKNNPDVLGHCDKIIMHNKNRYFTQDEQWYKDEVVALFNEVKKKNIVVEVNTRGIYRKRAEDFYPSTYWLKYLVSHNVPLTISTDCHKEDETDMLYADAVNVLKQIGCKKLYYFESTWKDAPIECFC